MTGKEPNKDNDRLARLYREQGDIEPGPGVDQRIRARAKADTRLSGLPRPAHWLGGVAVAASLFVVVSIVTNIQPPEAELPATQSTRTNTEERAPEAEAPEAEAPEAGATESADFAPLTSGDVGPRAEPRAPEQRAEAEALERQAEPEALAEKDEPEALEGQAEPETLAERARPPASSPASDTMLQRRTRWSAADDAAATAREQYRAVGEFDGSVEGDAQVRAPMESTVESEFDLADEEAADAERSLWLIGQLISIGNVERARARMEDFRERYPEQGVPEQLIEELEKLESSVDPD